MSADLPRAFLIVFFPQKRGEGSSGVCPSEPGYVPLTHACYGMVGFHLLWEDQIPSCILVTCSSVGRHR